MSAPVPAPAIENPWPGLAAFEEDAAALFFGRGGPTDELLRLIRRETTTVLFGESGLGKTSLLQAGAAPGLRAEGFLPVFIRMSFAPGAPPLRQQVLDTLALAHSGDMEAEEQVRCEGDTWRALHSATYPALARSDGLVPVLVFDQFEEFFSRRPMDAARLAEDEAFVEDLADLVENRPPADLRRMIEADPSLLGRYSLGADRYRIVLSLREDFLPHLETIRRHAPTLGRNRLRLRKMTGEEAFDAVIGPGRGLVSPEVAEDVVRFVGRESGTSGAEGSVLPLHALTVDPSLLSLFCRELNDGRKAAGLQRIDRDLFFASRDEILTSFYERAFVDQPEGVRRLVEDELVSEDGRMRVDMPLVRFVRDAGSDAALETLVRRRILRIEERQFQRVELIHDILVRVVVASRLARQERERADAARREQERVYGERQRKTRLRALSGIGLVVAAALLVGGFLALRAQRSRNAAERRVFACVISFAPRPDAASDVLARYRMPESVSRITDGSGACRSGLTQVLRDAGRSPGDIVAWWTATLAMSDARDPVQRAAELGQAIAESGAAADRAYAAQLAAAYSFQSSLYSQAGRKDLAEVAQRKAASVFGGSQEARGAATEVAELQHGLGRFALDAGRPAEARARFRKALDLRGRVTTDQRLRTRAASVVERNGLADEYASLGRAYANLAERNPTNRAALLAASDRLYVRCRSREDGAAVGLTRGEAQMRLINAKCFADHGRALQRLDPKRSRTMMVRALAQQNFDLVGLPPGERDDFYSILDSVAAFDEGQMLLNPGEKSERARVFRTWLVVARRDVFAAEPTRANRDLLVEALVRRSWYFLYAGNQEAAVVDTDAATYLNKDDVPLKFVRGHAALLAGNEVKAKTLYREAGALLRSRAREIDTLTADFATLRRAGVGSDALFAKAVDEARVDGAGPVDQRSGSARVSAGGAAS